MTFDAATATHLVTGTGVGLHRLGARCDITADRTQRLRVVSDNDARPSSSKRTACSATWRIICSRATSGTVVARRAALDDRLSPVEVTKQA